MYRVANMCLCFSDNKLMTSLIFKDVVDKVVDHVKGLCNYFKAITGHIEFIVHVCYV